MLGQCEYVVFHARHKDSVFIDHRAVLHPTHFQFHLRPVSYTHLRAHETVLDLVCRLLLEKKKNNLTHASLRTYTYSTTHYMISSLPI